MNPRSEVEVGDQPVADVVDLASPQVDHRPDALRRQRRLAQPVHLAVDLPAECGRNVGRDASPSTRRRQIATRAISTMQIEPSASRVVSAPTLYVQGAAK